MSGIMADPLTIEDLANITTDAAGSPHWKGYVPVRLSIGNSETVAILEAVLVEDDQDGPHLLLTPDFPDMIEKISREARRMFLVGYQRRDKIRDEVWAFFDRQTRVRATNRRDYIEIIQTAFGESGWSSAKSHELLERIHRGLQDPAEREKLQRVVD